MPPVLGDCWRPGAVNHVQVCAHIPTDLHVSESLQKNGVLVANDLASVTQASSLYVWPGYAFLVARLHAISTCSQCFIKRVIDMADFNDEMRKKIIDQFGANFPLIRPGHLAVDAILKEALASPGLQAKANADYPRTYTKGEYTLYDRTVTGKEAIDLPLDFDDVKIEQILKDIEG